MLQLLDLADLYGLFGSGIVIGIMFITLFFIIGSVVAFLYSIMSRA